MTTVTTRTGDKGTTCIGGGRIDKTHPIVEIVGILDHTQALIGNLYSYGDLIEEILPSIELICNDFYTMMGLLHKSAPDFLTKDEVKPFLENLDNIIKLIETPKVNVFLRPNKNTAIANNTRAHIRRYELVLWKLDDRVISQYFNRLSSVVYAIMLNIHMKTESKIQPDKPTQPHTDYNSICVLAIFILMWSLINSI